MSVEAATWRPIERIPRGRSPDASGVWASLIAMVVGRRRSLSVLLLDRSGKFQTKSRSSAGIFACSQMGSLIANNATHKSRRPALTSALCSAVDRARCWSPQLVHLRTTHSRRASNGAAAAADEASRSDRKPWARRERLKATFSCVSRRKCSGDRLICIK